jgi:hypothetical protein
MTEPSDADRTPDADTAAETKGEADDIAEKVEGEAEEAELEAYDLDGDGRISLTENARAELGILDAAAEEAAEEPGLKGKVAKATHRLLDKLDND